jgi:hypothetical protein
MICKLIGKRHSTEGRINAFHVTMFHGEGRREQVAEWESSDHAAGDDLAADPIQYTCNGYRTPDLAMPSLHFVASADARAALEGLPGLSFAPVELAKVIYLPYTVGDFSYFDREDFRRNPHRFGHDTVFRRHPDRPDLHAAVAPRWEVVCWNAHLVAPKYPEAREVLLQHPSGDFAPEASPLSKRMLQDHSLLTTMGGTACTLNVFGRLERFLDPSYYAIAEVDVGGGE